MAPAVRLTPLIVYIDEAVDAVPADVVRAVNEVADKVKTGTPADSIVNGKALDINVPFWTVICAVPAAERSVARIEADNCVGET